MIYVFLADGFEEIEALAPVDILRRLGLGVKTVAIKGCSAVGSHGIEVKCDISADEFKPDENLEAVILPGGMPGSVNLFESETVKNALEFADKNGRLMCAICAAPFVLGRLGYLKGKKATCFPGFEKDLEGAQIVTGCPAVTDGNVITARGAGAALEFGAAIGAYFKGKEQADEVLRGMQWRI